jgi:hypothetical protein
MNWLALALALVQLINYVLAQAEKKGQLREWEAQALRGAIKDVEGRIDRARHAEPPSVHEDPYRRD